MWFQIRFPKLLTIDYVSVCVRDLICAVYSTIQSLLLLKKYTMQWGGDVRSTRVAHEGMPSSDGWHPRIKILGADQIAPEPNMDIHGTPSILVYVKQKTRRLDLRKSNSRVVKPTRILYA